MIHVPDDWEAGFGASAGFLDVEPALHAMIRCARHGGVELMDNTPALAWGASSQGAWVRTEDKQYDADALIVTAGAWAGRMLEQLALPLAIQRKVLWWLKVENPALYAPDRFPVFITDSVVYLQPAGNSCCLKNPVQCLFYHLYEGAVPWYPISFSTNLG